MRNKVLLRCIALQIHRREKSLIESNLANFAQNRANCGGKLPWQRASLFKPDKVN